MQILKYRVRTARLDAIFISHLHGDHIFGLPGLLTSLALGGRTAPLTLVGPAGLKMILDTIFQQSFSFLNYVLNFVALEDFELGEPVFETRYMRVSSIPLNHRIFCRGFRFEEINKRPRFNQEAIQDLEVPKEYLHLLKQGNTVTIPDGRTIAPAQVLLPPAAPMSYAYCSDTRYHEALVPYIEKTNLVYHEATFLHEHLLRAEATMHSTAREAAQIARAAGIGQLLLGHFSARYTDLSPILAEAQTIFAQTDLATEGNIYEVLPLEEVDSV